MLGKKDKKFKTHAAISVDDLVPDDNFYRQFEDHLDLNFVRDLVQDLYSPVGRPSINPVVFLSCS